MYCNLFTNFEPFGNRLFSTWCHPIFSAAFPDTFAHSFHCFWSFPENSTLNRRFSSQGYSTCINEKCNAVYQTIDVSYFTAWRAARSAAMLSAAVNVFTSLMRLSDR